MEGVAEEPLSCLGIAFGTQQKIYPVFVNSSIQSPPLAFDLHIDLIDSLLSYCLGVDDSDNACLTGGYKPGPTCTQMYGPPSSFSTRFFHISIAEAVAAVPTHAANDDLRSEMTPLE